MTFSVFSVSRFCGFSESLWFFGKISDIFEYFRRFSDYDVNLVNKPVPTNNTGSAEEPISLAKVKLNCKINSRERLAATENMFEEHAASQEKQKKIDEMITLIGCLFFVSLHGKNSTR